MMKTTKRSPHTSLPLLSVLLLTLLTLPGLLAQTDPSTNASSPIGTNVGACSNQWGANGGHHHGPGAFGLGLLNITPAERQQLVGDFMQIKDNPQFVAATQSVVEASKNLLQTGTNLIIQADPSAQAIFDKIQPQIAQLIQGAQLGQLGQLGQTNN